MDALCEALYYSGQGTTKSQIISPCGTGKTRIQISLHVEDMIQLDKRNETGVYVIASHRLSLNRQLLREFIDVAVQSGLPFDVLYIGSYKCDLPSYYTKYNKIGYSSKVSSHLATTNREEIENFIQASRDNHRNVIVASTYDSFPALKNVGKINICTFDEAHNTIQDDFKANILQVKPNILREYYFTATRKIAGDDGGMNDKEFYGEIITDVFPRLMLERGEIVQPRLHLIAGDHDQTTDTTNTGMLVENTLEAFDQHRYYVKHYSISPDDVGAKLLVGCNSIEEMIRIYNAIKSSINYQAFAISSDGCFVNWISSGKENFFTKLNDLPDSEDAIIFNVDMLTEGIDLPSITGVMPLRNLGQTKLIQLVGRALRLHKQDRAKLYANELTPCDYTQYIKPYGFLIVPKHLASLNHYSEMIKLASLFYSEYGTKAEELIIQEEFNPIKPDELESMIPFEFRDGKKYRLEHKEMNLIDEINRRLFAEDMAHLSNFEQIKYLQRMLAE
jgi:hypothetical protein